MIKIKENKRNQSLSMNFNLIEIYPNPQTLISLLSSRLSPATNLHIHHILVINYLIILIGRLLTKHRIAHILPHLVLSPARALQVALSRRRVITAHRLLQVIVPWLVLQSPRRLGRVSARIGRLFARLEGRLESTAYASLLLNKAPAGGKLLLYNTRVEKYTRDDDEEWQGHVEVLVLLLVGVVEVCLFGALV